MAGDILQRCYCISRVNSSGTFRAFKRLAEGRQGYLLMSVQNTSVEVEAVPVADIEGSESLAPPWKVLIFDDPVNLMSFVTLMIRRIFGYSEPKATELMLQVHHKGRAIVWTGDREKAELFVQQLQSCQLLAAMEPVD